MVILASLFAWNRLRRSRLRLRDSLSGLEDRLKQNPVANINTVSEEISREIRNLEDT